MRKVKSQPIEQCMHCLEAKKSSTMKTCSGCNTARYCSKDCFKHNWKQHKSFCEENKNLSFMKRTNHRTLQKSLKDYFPSLYSTSKLVRCESLTLSYRNKLKGVFGILGFRNDESVSFFSFGQMCFSNCV
ncbi:hypothetical protein HDU92_002118 [Lobulomyces angularis]|nr:hypothetical protein HDU92_002118 [Lobulomyces angularis]